jgi:hypothetical protein
MIKFRDLQNEVYNFAKERGMLKDLENQGTTFEFLEWIFEMEIEIDKVIEVGSFLNEYWIERMDWYLFIRPYKNGDTIAEIYARHANDAELSEAVKRLKSPEYEMVEVKEVQDGNKIIGTQIGRAHV